jgi:hypothetical protein
MKGKITIALCLLLCFGSCRKEQWDDCFTAAGKDGVETRTVGTFDKLLVDDKIDLRLIQNPAKSGTIVIRGGSNLFEGITTEIVNGRLEVDNQNICNFVRSYKKKMIVEVYFNNLVGLEVATAANVTSVDTLRIPFLDILHHSMGDINLTLISDEVFVQSLNGAGTILRGKVTTVKSSIEGISFLDTRDCESSNVFVDTHSPLDCYINANDIIFVKIYNSGNIYYVKEPSTKKEVNEKTGEGELLLLQ